MTPESSNLSSVTLVDSANEDLVAAWVYVRDAQHLTAEALSAAGFGHEMDLSCTIYTATAPDHALLTTYRAQVVPCIRIWGAECKPLAAVVCFRKA